MKTIYNLSQNDVIGVMSGNSANVMGLLYACLYNGTPINALDSSFSVKDVVHIWSRTRPKIVFCEEKCISVVQKSLKKIGLNSPIITLDSSSQSTESIENLLQPFSHPQFEFFFQPSDLVEGGKQTATILTSSGTSGPPKSVCLSHRDILTWFKSRGFSQRDTALNYSTLFWVSGLTTYLNAGILGCSMVATKKPFSPRSCLEIIEKYKVNVLSIPPWYLSMILAYEHVSNEQLSSIFAVMIVGAAPALEHRRALFELLPPTAVLCTGYGMTEVSKTTLLLQFRTLENSDSVGNLTSGMKVRIIDDNGDAVGPKETGEIVIKSKYSWQGYYKDPENTAKALNSEGWYHSGDLGFFDKKGLLHIVGRKKEILKVNGYHVSPIEIEQTILQLRGVSEACVFGVKDDLTANRLYVAAARSNLIEKSITAEEIASHLEKQLAPHKRISQDSIFFVHSLPRTPTGKVLRREVLRLFEEKQLN